jgi:hypothetical protein
LLTDDGIEWRFQTEWGQIWSQTETGIQFNLQHPRHNQRHEIYFRNVFNINFESAQNMTDSIMAILNKNKDITKYKNYDFRFVGSHAVDAGGVSREAYANIFKHYFSSNTFELFRIDHLIQKYNIESTELDFAHTSMSNITLNHNYYQFDKNIIPKNINNFGYLIGYICELCKNGFIFRAGLSFDKYFTCLVDKKSNNNFISNYNHKIKSFCEKNMQINYEDINIYNYPVISEIISQLTFCGNYIDNFEKRLDDIITSININCESKLLLRKIILEYICDIYFEPKDNLHNINLNISTSIIFNDIITFLTQVYQKIYNINHDDFIKDLSIYVSINNIAGWKEYLMNDEYDTKIKLISAIENNIMESFAKQKIIRAIKCLEYDEIRKLLHFWTSSKYMLNKTYHVKFMTDNANLPISHTCSYELEIPNIDNAELVKRIKINLEYSTQFGFM